ncbi:MAG: DUF1080 domain-containing protein [Planctomycetes bacterium]|nr:DUF1080 domain-containing protein [Planctomycetota bacterium]
MFHALKLTLAAALLAALGSAASAAPAGKGTFTDPAKAGPDYAVQGEYSGDKFGAQVIALGGGKFELVLYTGSLPGEGWKRKDKVQRVKGETKNGVTTFKSDALGGTISGNKLSLTGSGGDALGTLKKISRKSKTLGAKPSKGAIVLFDGTTAEHFKGGKMTADKLLMAGCETKRKFGDHTLHVEFRTPFKPYGRGQGRGNSGVYIQNRYECQVLDSFGLKGANNECGGIYSINVPKVNMCYPPLTWQTYDIEFTAARYKDGKKVKNARTTIRHNGYVIHDDLELTHGTPGKNKEGPGPDGIYFQGHGNPVVFRNVWVIEKK